MVNKCEPDGFGNFVIYKQIPPFGNIKVSLRIKGRREKIIGTINQQTGTIHISEKPLIRIINNQRFLAFHKKIFVDNYMGLIKEVKIIAKNNTYMLTINKILSGVEFREHKIDSYANLIFLKSKGLK